MKVEKVGWKPGNTVEHFISHERMDADEHFIHALDMVFPDVVARVFPKIRSAKIGSISTDRVGMTDEEGVWHDFEKFGSPNTVFVGVGKGLIPGSFDEHDELNKRECAATKMIAQLHLSKEMRRAISNSLSAVLYEEKYGTEVAYEIPGLVKQLHDTGLYTEVQVRDWSALAYAAQIKKDLDDVKSGQWKSKEEKGWQLCVGTAYDFIKTYYGEKAADNWIAVAATAMSYNLTLKDEARREILRVKSWKNLRAGETSIVLENTRIGEAPMLSIFTENRMVVSEAINKFRYAIVVVRNSEGNTQVMMDRTKKWCSCNVCAELRDRECEVRGLKLLTRDELYSHDSVAGCPFWNRFQEAPYVGNGTLKHSSVEPTKLALWQVIECVKKGVCGHFRCPDWRLHHWLFKKDSEEVEKERKEKRYAIDASLMVLFEAVEKEMAELANSPTS